MVLRREPWRRQNLGCSRYNNNYACHVRELREVGPAELELDFAAHGDNSLGPEGGRKPAGLGIGGRGDG